jgi:ABC-type nickel/cobalt efflux system permease component RcnA
MLALGGFLFGKQTIKDRRKRQLHGLDNNIDLGQQQQHPQRSPTSRGTGTGTEAEAERIESRDGDDIEMVRSNTRTSTQNYDLLKRATHAHTHDSSDAHSEAHVRPNSLPFPFHPPLIIPPFNHTTIFPLTECRSQCAPVTNTPSAVPAPYSSVTAAR